jgi:hypothetical protein
MSEAFSQSPPVYANTGGANNRSALNTTPYPTSTTSMPMPLGMGMGAGPSTSHSYPYGYPPIQVPETIYRDSIQTAVLDKVRYNLDETIQIGNAQIDSLRRTEQDLINGEKTIQLLINNAQQQQVQAQVFIFYFRFIL